MGKRRYGRRIIMKLTKTQLKQLIIEAMEDEEFALPTPNYEIDFSEAVSDAVDQLGGARVLEIVEGVIRTLEI